MDKHVVTSNSFTKLTYFSVLMQKHFYLSQVILDVISLHNEITL